MKWPSLPRVSIDPGDLVAMLGLVSVSAGVWGRWGWASASIVTGSLLLVAYAVRELHGGAR